ncbi:MAG: EamA family transporter [Chloroflexota bacterium]
MSPLALACVLLAAVSHATWNLLARRADEKLAFLWCGNLVASVVFAPLGIWLLATHPIPPAGWGVVGMSAVLEALYYWTLAQAYRYGELSLVYPIARGTAPILVPVLAMLFLGEHLSGLALSGIGLVVVGTVAIHTRALGMPTLGAVAGVIGQLGTRYALLTGLVIATYSALDKYGVSLVTPLLYGYLLFCGLTLILLPAMLRQRTAVLGEWQRHRGSIVVVGLLAPASYGLVLLALTLAPVSYVAAAREVSVVLAALLGAVVLREGYGRQRLLGSTAIAAGLMLLVLG